MALAMIVAGPPEDSMTLPPPTLAYDVELRRIPPKIRPGDGWCFRLPPGITRINGR